MADKPSKLKIADREFASRLLVGTGKFASNELMRDALIASGTELVTVAIRRADLSGKHDPFANILDFIDPKRFLLLPNTSGARNAEEAVRLARDERRGRLVEDQDARAAHQRLCDLYPLLLAKEVATKTNDGRSTHRPRPVAGLRRRLVRFGRTAWWTPP